MLSSIERINGPQTNYTQEMNDKSNGDITYDDFMNLLVTQLRYQDPMNPMDNNEFINQTTNFTQLEELTKMSSSMEKIENSLVSKNNSESLLSASSFLGKEVTYSSKNIEMKDEGTILRFNLSSTPSNTKIQIFDSLNNLVGEYTPENVSKGENILEWDGTLDDGTKLPNGIYSYLVQSTNSMGDGVQSWTFDKGVVQGVTQLDGKLLFQIGNQQVEYGLIYSVSNLTED
jgi:flagellar basal-body rod modification protein FlgD